MTKEYFNQAHIEKDIAGGTLNRINWFTKHELANLKDGWRVKHLYSRTCRVLVKGEDKIRIYYVAPEFLHTVLEGS